MQIHARCVSILADLWKVPQGSKAIGTATGGSSEAIMLGQSFCDVYEGGLVSHNDF